MSYTDVKTIYRIWMRWFGIRKLRRDSKERQIIRWHIGNVAKINRLQAELAASQEECASMVVSRDEYMRRALAAEAVKSKIL